MAISETKMQMVIANYFKDECDVNTSVRQAFEKGFRIGVKKGASTNRPQEWIPCNERLPEDPNPSFTYGSKTYQVTTGSGKVVALTWQKTKVRGKTVMRWEWSDGVIYHGDVLAWKPLSEPWKGADDEH